MKTKYSLSNTYLLSENLKFHSEFSTGFRFPTLSELYFNGETPRGTTLGNINLEPETSRTLGIALTYQIE
ncbi:TonB-dependent receptor [Pseudoalteromonas sp. NBT06-2]|uniref:TonB-dependent receptor domain-containing protein n=1 Tax=Pseudoalteromonas sp. NBT06-2 TaxID=2025950 RepID=UPI001140E6CA